MITVPISRRFMLAGSSVGIVTSLSATVMASPNSPKHRANTFSIEGEKRPPPNPIDYWSDVISDLISLDHTIDQKDAKAWGPVAAQRAAALAHVVMADAVATSYTADYHGLYVRQHHSTQHPDAFIGGATAQILKHIFSGGAHGHFLAEKRQAFLATREAGAYHAWDAGLSFGQNQAFTSRWNAREISDALTMEPASANYTAPPRGHVADPFNPDQGFYAASWGRVPTLTPGFGRLADYGPGDPPGEHDDRYRHDLQDVTQVGALRTDEPTPEQVSSALFWAFCGPRVVGPPVRLYNSLIRQIAGDDRVSLPGLARILALCNLAMADAGSVCWAAKYYYRLWRPVVAIRERGIDWRPFGGPRTNPVQFGLGQDGGPQRLPYHLACFTPPFPTYPSGHASFAGAAFGMLRKIRREYVRGDPDRINPDLRFISEEVNGVSIDNFQNRPRPFVPRTFSSLQQMIDDNGRSRIHLGVHFQFDCDNGAKSGEHVADAVYRSAYRRQRQHEVPVSDAGEIFRAHR